MFTKNVFILLSSYLCMSAEIDDETFLDDLKKTIKEYLTDLTYIDVTTLIGDPKKTKWKLDPSKNIKEQIADMDVTLLAKTVIELDGDITQILPGDPATGDVITDKEILQLHKESVDAAVENWDSFVKNMIEAVSQIRKFLGKS
jgi:phosphoribosylformylglycinamidine (FGAM) synthase PurS component